MPLPKQRRNLFDNLGIAKLSLLPMAKYQTVSQFADSLGVTRSAIYKALEEGRIKALQLVAGGQWLITDKEAKLWTAHKVKVRARLVRTRK